MVERPDLPFAQRFTCDEYRGVDQPKGEIRVPGLKPGGRREQLRVERVGDQRTRANVLAERHPCVGRRELITHELDDLRGRRS